MQRTEAEIVVIGGSAGSLPVLMALLDALPDAFPFAVLIVLHRLKNVYSEMSALLSVKSGEMIVREPDDKAPVLPNNLYLAPQNYHLLIERDRTFSLDYSEPVLYSRPSIDVTFDSVADIYVNKAVGIVLSGANEDGAHGLTRILAKGGTGMIQHPDTAEYQTMPRAARQRNPDALLERPDELIERFQVLNL